MFYVQQTMPGPPRRYISMHIDAWTSPKFNTHLNSASQPRKIEKLTEKNKISLSGAERRRAPTLTPIEKISLMK